MPWYTKIGWRRGIEAEQDHLMTVCCRQLCFPRGPA